MFSRLPVASLTKPTGELSGSLLAVPDLAMGVAWGGSGTSPMMAWPCLNPHISRKLCEPGKPGQSRCRLGPLRDNRTAQQPPNSQGTYRMHVSRGSRLSNAGVLPAWGGRVPSERLLARKPPRPCSSLSCRSLLLPLHLPRPMALRPYFELVAELGSLQ